jgi:hypothetical protein
LEGAGPAGWHTYRADRKAVSLLHSFRRCRACGVPIWVPIAASMEADLGISKWAIVALVAAMIAVGTIGLVVRSGATRDRTPPASAPAAQSR